MMYLVQRQRVAVSRCDTDGGAEGQPASAAEVEPADENREGGASGFGKENNGLSINGLGNENKAAAF